MVSRKYLLLSALLLVLFSHFCLADVTLSEQEYEELTTIFGKLGSLLDEQKIQLSKLDAQLVIADDSLAKALMEIKRQKDSLAVLKKSLAGLRAEAITWTVIIGLGSLAVGLIVGLLL